MAAAGLNRCEFIGNVGNDPQLKTLKNGALCCQISLAINERSKNKEGQPVDYVEWVRMSAYNKTAEIIAKHTQKGSRLYIDGQMRTRKYEKNGENHYFTEIIIGKVLFLDSKPTSENAQPPKSYQSNQEQSSSDEWDDVFNDEIPF